MKCYLDITLLPSAEIPLLFLWQKVYFQVHLALVEIQDEKGKANVGTAFPEYNLEGDTLGHKLRLLADEQAFLECLNIHQWLSRLSDYVHITRIREIPSDVSEYSTYKRIQVKSSTKRLARRKAKREGISYDEAWLAIGKRKEKVTRVPFINMQSQSTGKYFPLFILKEIQKPSSGNEFSTYGLSGTSSIPEF